MVTRKQAVHDKVHSTPAITPDQAVKIDYKAVHAALYGKPTSQQARYLQELEHSNYESVLFHVSLADPSTSPYSEKSEQRAVSRQRAFADFNRHLVFASLLKCANLPNLRNQEETSRE